MYLNRFLDLLQGCFNQISVMIYCSIFFVHTNFKHRFNIEYKPSISYHSLVESVHLLQLCSLNKRCHFFSCDLKKWTLTPGRSPWPRSNESRVLLLFTFLRHVLLIDLTCCVSVWFWNIIMICVANYGSTSCVHSHSDPGLPHTIASYLG